MLFDDTYKTIKQPAEGTFKDKGSKFIAFAYPLHSETEVKGIISKLRAEHTKANHFCYAYRLSPDRNIYRVNDDGEPSGTAGRPILNVLLSADLTNILILVVRYFGGTLLGVPGLINAYKSAAAEAIAVAVVVDKTVNDRYEIKFDYLVMNDVMRLIKEEPLNVIEQKFDNQCSIIFEVRTSQLNKVLQRIEKLTGVAVHYIGTN